MAKEPTRDSIPERIASNPGVPIGLAVLAIGSLNPFSPIRAGTDAIKAGIAKAKARFGGTVDDAPATPIPSADVAAPVPSPTPTPEPVETPTFEPIAPPAPVLVFRPDVASLDAIAASIEPQLTFNQLTGFDPRAANGAPGENVTWQEKVANLKSAMIREAARNPYSAPVARVKNGLRALDAAFPTIQPSFAETAAAGYMTPEHQASVYGSAPPAPEPAATPTMTPQPSGPAAGNDGGWAKAPGWFPPVPKSQRVATETGEGIGHFLEGVAKLPGIAYRGLVDTAGFIAGTAEGTANLALHKSEAEKRADEAKWARAEASLKDRPRQFWAVVKDGLNVATGKGWFR